MHETFDWSSGNAESEVTMGSSRGHYGVVQRQHEARPIIQLWQVLAMKQT